MARVRGKNFDKSERKEARAFTKENGMAFFELKHYGPMNGKGKRKLDRVTLYCGHFPTSTMKRAEEDGLLKIKKLGSY